MSTAANSGSAAGSRAVTTTVTVYERPRWWIALIVLATLGYYFWTVTLSTEGPPAIHGRESDHFNLLSRGFQKGHLYLDGDVPEELIRAANPYDPALRQKVNVLHDASYYKGRYYIYFGPAPVVTLLLPFSVITGRDLPLTYAVWIFSSVGYLALAGTFLFLQRRHHPGASAWTITAALVALGGASMVVALLRRANIWELSAASGFCYFAISVFSLVRAVHSRRAFYWATAGGLALGLAVASRPTYILCSVLFALPLVFRRWQRHNGSSYDWRALFGAAASCAIPVVGLLAYNYARFANPLEFGVTYQLTSVIESESIHFSLSYVAFNFRLYFLSLLRWLPYFPFANGISLPPLPPGHGGHEYTFGMFSNLPFSWFGLATAGILALPRFRRSLAPALTVSMAVIAGAAGLNAAFLLCFFGNCIRYMVDFAPWFMLLASIGLIVLESHFERAGWKRSLRSVGLGLALWSSFVAAASIVHFYDSNGQFPERYRSIARVVNAPFFRAQELRWPDYGPVEASLTFPADRSRRFEALAAVKKNGAAHAVVLVEYLEPDRVRFGYQEPASGRPAAFSPVVHAPPGATHRFRVSIGGPYSEFDGRKGRLRAEFDHLSFWQLPSVTPGVYPGKLVMGADAASGAAAPVFSGVIHSTRRITFDEFVRTGIRGVRVRLTFSPEMAGRAFPLITSGQNKAGDLLFVRMHTNGTITFGYDHWADDLLLSPPIPVTPGETRVIEFWVPAVEAPGDHSQVLVKMDGAVVWRQKAHAFPFAPENLFLGSNPIGGSTCEPVLEHGVFEELHLPPPAP